MLKRLFARAEPSPRVHRLPEGRRVYAIGDIHGRDDLFADLLARIDADDSGRTPARTTIVLLGDLIDRGPDSRGVVERAMQLSRERECVFLKGNHEELLLKVAGGDCGAAGVFVRAGGEETLLSYGLEQQVYDDAGLSDVTELTAAVVPVEHLAFMEAMGDHYSLGDYCLVHAGVRPGRALAEQRGSDLRWIRGDFLDDERDHGALIIHGHSIHHEVDQRHNRIGIDTGAYASGRLTAIGLEGSERWFLSTR